MRNIFLIAIVIFSAPDCFSQILNYKAMPDDISITGQITIFSPDSLKKISLKNNGTAFFDGKITAKEIEVKANVWADFVFKDGYNLLSIPELEEYIAEYGKLPEIPSEKEAKSGLNLAETDAKLLQKIEELTLYIIGQQKEIEKLKREVELLKKK